MKLKKIEIVVQINFKGLEVSKESSIKMLKKDLKQKIKKHIEEWSKWLEEID